MALIRAVADTDSHGPGLDTPWPNFLRSPQNFSPTYPLTGVLQSCAVLTAGIGIMSTLLDIPSLKIGDLQSEGITSLKGIRLTNYTVDGLVSRHRVLIS